ncbi:MULTISPECIES: 30S ribosomal protein THX [Sphingobacterium]|jgi:30S ribosomal protein S31|uniref:30S ribosomal protein Thx n=1 Tax=Sphingobacterium multivorum TaxID=28454 RepID=A0A2X2JKB2_SPHMU|nr:MULTISPECIES: 30S ribosomal protein THX [Sphingobacterium]HAF35515.1 30S ribosomal protein THX [Sphingobacterium sp.]MDF2850575.1 ribosomal small subunit protein bTHX [Sphingobacterium multivorum]OJZ01087.1 MAG: ribosomal small subunit protein bTHX [Sphingobacterium sp. 40-24]QQT46139.1 30S ribosomal protein THX [Sphingobacterium multivorum]QQT61298.1 30S ribosomal protein THX [Sphingobacterium multivorum]
MGKGDIKTRRGKISNGSFGKRRPHVSKTAIKAEVKQEAPKEVQPKAKSKK